MTVALSEISDGAAVIERAIFSSADSALANVAADAKEIAKMAVTPRLFNFLMPSDMFITPLDVSNVMRAEVTKRLSSAKALPPSNGRGLPTNTACAECESRL
jgi:hypothetical protein